MNIVRICPGMLVPTLKSRIKRLLADVDMMKVDRGGSTEDDSRGCGGVLNQIWIHSPSSQVRFERTGNYDCEIPMIRDGWKGDDE